MEVKIGVRHAPRELVIETSDTAEDVEAALASARRPTTAPVTLTDTRGRRVVVPGARCRLPRDRHRRLGDRRLPGLSGSPDPRSSPSGGDAA